MSKIVLTFKTPDVTDQIRFVSYNENDVEVTDDEATDNMQEFVKKFVEYSEYIDIEFDDVAKTAVVLSR